MKRLSHEDRRTIKGSIEWFELNNNEYAIIKNLKITDYKGSKKDPVYTVFCDVILGNKIYHRRYYLNDRFKLLEKGR